MNLKYAKSLAQFAAFYNATAVIIFLIPGTLPLLGVSIPESSFWRWLPGLLALFASLVLFMSSRDMTKYASFPYWNGIIRITFATIAFIMNYMETVGLFIGIIAIGDFILGSLCVLTIPHAVKKSHLQLLLNS